MNHPTALDNPAAPCVIPAQAGIQSRMSAAEGRVLFSGAAAPQPPRATRDFDRPSVGCVAPDLQDFLFTTCTCSIRSPSRRVRGTRPTRLRHARAGGHPDPKQRGRSPPPPPAITPPSGAWHPTYKTYHVPMQYPITLPSGAWHPTYKTYRVPMQYPITLPSGAWHPTDKTGSPPSRGRRTESSDRPRHPRVPCVIPATWGGGNPDPRPCGRSPLPTGR